VNQRITEHTLQVQVSPHNVVMYPPRWACRWSTKLSILGMGAVLGGGLGWVAGLRGAAIGAGAGLVAAYVGSIVALAIRKPNPERLLLAGRAQEALRQLELQVSYDRKLAAKLPTFRDMLAYRLVEMSEALQALGNRPRALEAVAEAAAIYSQLAANRSRRITPALAGTLLRQAALLAGMSRHGEALAAIEPATGIYRHLARSEPGTYLPHLAEALTRQSDALGYLDRITEARAAAAEADLIRTDMLPAALR
jgi:tetratricopeptide (TPR) repeat protein